VKTALEQILMNYRVDEINHTNFRADRITDCGAARIHALGFSR